MVKCSYIQFFVIILQISRNLSFNFDLNFVDIIGSNINGDHFGYSVLLQKGPTSQVIVGSPKSNSTLPNFVNIKEPGVLYQCKLGPSNLCQRYTIDQTGNSDYRLGDSRYHYKNRKDSGMLGAAIDGGENVNDPLVVCSPKWANAVTDRNGLHYLLNGMCYFIQNSSNLDETGTKLLPLLDLGNQGYQTGQKVEYYYAMGQAGMSVNYLGNKEELLLGAPGVLSWKGTVIQYKALSSNISPPQQRLTHSRSKRQIYANTNIPNPVFISSLKEVSTYFGYSISSGKFKSNYDEIWYVTGAPRGENLYGLVILYNFPIVPNADLRVEKKFIGNQLGSYFGAAVLSVDVTGNHADDLLIGAPTYFTKVYDEGCVYFYKNDGDGNFEEPLKIFGSKYVGARFGTTISSIGDINKDSIQDVAIAAPYEENGVVYIYLGSASGLSAEPNQRISAKQIDKSLQGFGFSISRGVDIDQNLYNDIAIGAYKSSQVAIIKSRPVIQFKGELYSNLNELSLQTKNFNVTYCLSYLTATNNIEEVDAEIRLIKDQRTVNANDVVETIKLKKNIKTCKTIDIVLKAGSSDYSKSYKIEMIFTITNRTETEFCPFCPVIDPINGNSAVLNIPFANGCKNNNICKPELKILANFENDLKSLTIGSSNSLKINIRVENHGEPAYLTKVQMQVPIGVEILQISGNCYLNENQLYSCMVDDALQPNDYKNIVFDLDIKKLNPKDTNLSFNITVESKGEDVNPNDNFVVKNLPLQLYNTIEIAGKSSPDQIVYVDEENNIKFKMVNLTHEFFFKNEGPSPLLGAEVSFNFPIEIKTFKNIFDVGEPEALINNQISRCGISNDLTDFRNGAEEEDLDVNQEVETIRRFRRATESEKLIAENIDLPDDRTLFVNCSNSEVKCKSVKCTTNDIIAQNQFIRVKFMVTTYIDSIHELLEGKDILLYSSSAKLITNGKTIENVAKTVLIGSLIQKEVSYWIYIICVIVGIIILALIIFLLYKCNFFQRPIRERLDNNFEEEGESAGAIRSLNEDDVDEKY